MKKAGPGTSGKRAWKQILLPVAAAILVPVLAGTVIGGVYIVVQLIRGYTFAEAMIDVEQLQQSIMPYTTALFVIAIVLLVIRAIRSRQKS
ncbi:hypothetical protein ACFO9Q_07560 [Paenibacillus sp. GCM10023252]|uniref:hypothetical protein n=1 Tax=Paenibacillus sp. GCM10023252 TaxID=3252649 RepID=UPI003607C75D